MNRLEIDSDDESLCEDLGKANIPGLQIAQVVNRQDSSGVTIFQQYVGVAVEVLKGPVASVALGVLSAMIYDHVIKNPTKKYKIDENEIPKNLTQIQIIVNNHFQSLQNDKGDSTKK